MKQSLLVDLHFFDGSNKYRYNFIVSISYENFQGFLFKL